MSRELFREHLSAEGPSAVSAFQAFMHTSVALGERRAGVVSTMSRAAHLDPVELHRAPQELDSELVRHQAG